MSDVITMSRSDLSALAGEMARQMAAVMQHQQALPEMYAFPDDIIKITKGTVPENTIIYWRQQGWLKTVKLGRHRFVLPEDWQYFVKNYPKLKGKRPQ